MLRSVNGDSITRYTISFVEIYGKNELFVHFDDKKRYDLNRTSNQIGGVFDSQTKPRVLLERAA